MTPRRYCGEPICYLGCRDRGDAAHAAMTCRQQVIGSVDDGPPGIELRVVDEDGSLLQHRQVGELAIRGAAVTRRYVTPAGSRDALDADGWLATGDLGYRTEAGEIVVCGRKKDMIIVAGRNICPTDIERAAGRVDGVRPGNAVAVRLTSPAHRESFAVAVESHAHNDSGDKRRIMNDVSRAVFAEIGASPRLVTVTGPGTLPKTPSGKLRRSATYAIIAKLEELDRSPASTGARTEVSA